jgi:hypothetical protein
LKNSELIIGQTNLNDNNGVTYNNLNRDNLEEMAKYLMKRKNGNIGDVEKIKFDLNKNKLNHWLDNFQGNYKKSLKRSIGICIAMPYIIVWEWQMMKIIGHI